MIAQLSVLIMLWPYLPAQIIWGELQYLRQMADKVCEISQALKHALNEDSSTERIHHFFLNTFEGSKALARLSSLVFLALVEQEVVQLCDTQV